MKVFWNICLFSTFTLCMLRIFTGILSYSDDPTRAYVIKTTPSLAIERRLSNGFFSDHYFVLLSVENDLPQEDNYRLLMEKAFEMAGLLIVLAVASDFARRF